MEKHYKIEYYPKFKNQDKSKLGGHQITLRNKSKKYIYKEEKTCNKCFKLQPIKEFYIKNKQTGRRNLSCRDCQMKKAGVLEIGKQRFADQIESKGFRRCTLCKNIKPLTEFTKNKGQKNGISNSCYNCANYRHHEFLITQRENVGDFYVKQYCIRVHGFSPRTKKEIEKFRNEIIEKRKPLYFCDNKSFFTLKSFAEYILDNYQHPTTQTKKRISKGASEDDCKLTTSKYRSKSKRNIIKASD